MQLKVFLVDDEIAIREGIRSSSLWDEENYTLVGWNGKSDCSGADHYDAGAAVINLVNRNNGKTHSIVSPTVLLTCW